MYYKYRIYSYDLWNTRSFRVSRNWYRISLEARTTIACEKLCGWHEYIIPFDLVN